MSEANTPFDILIRGGRCVLPSVNNPAHLEESDAEIGIRGEKIVAIGTNLKNEARKIIDAKGLHVLPGAIDTQVHFREPGLTHKEDLESGTRGAILGGVTALFEMPNTKPSTTTKEALDEKFARAEGRAWSDYAFYVGAAPENVTQLAKLETRPGCSGVKVFMGSSTGSLLISDEELLAQVLANGRRRVSVHAEDEGRLIERKAIAVESGNVADHPVWRDELTALRATERLTRLAKQTKRPIHVLHVSTAEEMDLLRSLKTTMDVTVEILPQHLTLTAPECYERLGTLAQMNPPIRDRRHQEALWKAVSDGTVDVMGSDHAPHTLEEKALPYPQSPSGLTGVQTILPLMLHHANQGRLSTIRVVELLARNPARIWGITGKGEIRVGNDADFALVDLKADREITNEWIASKSGWTPFAGMRISAWPIATILRGHEVMRDDQVIGRPLGHPLQFTR